MFTDFSPFGSRDFASNAIQLGSRILPPKSDVALPFIGQLPKLHIWLRRSYDGRDFGDWALDRLTLDASKYLQDLRFNQSPSMSRTLSNQLIVGFRDLLPTSSKQELASSRDRVVDVGSSVLRGLTVSVYRVKKGVQRVLVTFKELLGGLVPLFAPGAAPKHLADLEAELSTRTLDNVLIPALAVAATDPISEYEKAEERLNAFVQRLKDNKHGIEFYAALLTRFVAARDAERADALTYDVLASVSPAIPNRLDGRPSC